MLSIFSRKWGLINQHIYNFIKALFFTASR